LKEYTLEQSVIDYCKTTYGVDITLISADEKKIVVKLEKDGKNEEIEIDSALVRLDYNYAAIEIGFGASMLAKPLDGI